MAKTIKKLEARTEMLQVISVINFYKMNVTGDVM